MPSQDPEKSEARYSGRKSLSSRYNKDTNGYDVESQTASAQAAPFPGATYGFHPADQPTQPPRRVPSLSSLRKARSMASLQTDPNAPEPETTQNPDQHPDESVAEELAWNPSHPCYPHPNPHVPLSSPAYNLTRIIRIRRDWMAHGDLAPSYSNIYPEILDPLLPETEFRFLINHINKTLFEAFDPFSAWNWVDGVLGLVTGWLWEDLRPGGMKGKLRGLEFWIDQWNQRVGSRNGVCVIPLRRTAYMSLDIEIPDPQVRVVDPNEEQDGADIDDTRPDDSVGVAVEQYRHRQHQMHVGDIRRGTTATTVTETDSRV